MRLVKNVVGLFAGIGSLALLSFVAFPDSFFQIFGTNVYLYAGIGLVGLAAFAWWIFRVFRQSADSYYAMFESASLAGIICVPLILENRDTLAWNYVLVAAIILTVLCIFLRFLDPRRNN